MSIFASEVLFGDALVSTLTAPFSARLTFRRTIAHRRKFGAEQLRSLSSRRV